MPRIRTVVVCLIPLLAALLVGPLRADALIACTAADIVSQDGTNCPPGTGPCTIKKDFTIPTGCILDFGARDATLANLATLTVGSNVVTIKARNFTVAAGGYIDGRGLGTAAPTDAGGALTIQTTAAVAVQKSTQTGRIEVSGTNAAGMVTINAGTSVTVSGRIESDSLGTADGGVIEITAGTDIISGAASDLSAAGAGGGSGGAISLSAGGRIDLGAAVDINGYDGGSLDASTGTDMVLRTINARGIGAASGAFIEPGLGGTIDAEAGTSLNVAGQMIAVGTGGGCGGCVTLYSDFGNLTVNDKILAEGGLPEPVDSGAGGGIATLSAVGSLVIGSTGEVSARSDGSFGYGGIICLEASQSITANGPVDASGGACGGSIDVAATRAVTTSAAIDVSGRAAGGFGGALTVIAGDVGVGALSIGALVSAAGGPCSLTNGCGTAGSALFEGCDVTVQTTGQIDSRAPDGGGRNLLTAHEQLRINGPVLAAATGSGLAGPGINELEFPSRKSPIITAGMVSPAAALLSRGTCVAQGDPPACLAPCPTCGNGIVEFPETCDDNALSCDGCSASCRIENCDDSNVCTVDSCDQTLGCRHVALVPCNTGTATPTATIPVAATPTPTPSGTPTITPPLPSATPTTGTFALAGQVRYSSSNVAVPGATIAVSGATSTSAQTTATGAFNFASLSAGTIQVEPLKVGDARNGISALDASYVLQRVVGARTFTADQAVACDVTGNGAISALDATRILQFVVGQITRFDVANNCASDWVFFPNATWARNQTQTAAQISTGICQRSRITYTPLAADATGQDFRALLFGDCTQNWTPPPAAAPASALLARAAATPRTVTVGALHPGRGREVRVPVSLNRGVAFQGLEMTLRYDPSALRVLGAHARGVAEGAPMAANTAVPGEIRVAFASAEPIISTGTPILTLRFESRDARPGRTTVAAAAVTLDEAN